MTIYHDILVTFMKWCRKSSHWWLWCRWMPVVSQGSVLTHIRCGGIFNSKFTAEFPSERISKISWHLMK